MFRNEMKKLLTHPVLWCLFIVCMLYNLFLLWVHVEPMREELLVVHKLAAETVTESRSGGKLIERSGGKSDGKSTERSGGKSNEKSDAEKRIEEIYTAGSLEASELYDRVNMIEIKDLKEELQEYHPKGTYKRYIDTGYERLQRRVEEIRKNGEEMQAFYPGIYYELHNVLYHRIIKPVLLEMMLIMSIGILFLMDYERMQKTGELVYSSKAGRRIQKIKIKAGLSTGFLFCIVLLFSVLAIYFSKISYQGLWDVSVSSAMLAEYRGILFYPFITYVPMNIWQYLLATITIALLLVLVIGLLTAGIYLFLQNSYFSFLLEILLLFFFRFLAEYSTVTFWDVICKMNPTMLWFYCGRWFMEENLELCFPGNEALSLAIQFLAAGIVLCLVYRKFLKSDIIEKNL
ncbi:MAG: hypothetical protein Q4F21_03325 [Lachnospiraceae bacterium]|nr:hypothetical protein [Lachnospiraceae bacterium]